MGLEKKIKTELQTILKTLSDLHCSRPFREPVDARRYPDYYQAVSRPMDLKTLRKNVIDNKYQTSDEFYQDAQLIFENCKIYTVDSTNPIRRQCDELERNFMYQWQNFIARRHEEQGLEHVNDETAEVLSMIHSHKRKPEPEVVTIIVPPPPVKRPKPPKVEESLSVSIVIPELEISTPPPVEPATEPAAVLEREDSSVVVKLSGKDLTVPEEPEEQEELNFDKLQGRNNYENVIKFTVPEMAPEPPPVREVPVVVSLPTPPVPDSEEYIRAALSALMTGDEAKAARKKVVETMHKYQFTFIPLDSC